MPGGRHSRHIIQHMTLRLLHCSKIGHHFFRLHDHLSQKKNPRADNLTDHAHQPDDGMYLGQISAGGAQFFPNVGNRVNADNVDPSVCQIEEIIHHLIKHPRVPVIEIPLIRIESGHHKAPRVRKPGKVARRRGGKYLRNRLLIDGRNIKGIVEEIAIHVFLFPGSGPFCPLVIL